jgi:hypothetical protein
MKKFDEKPLHYFNCYSTKKGVEMSGAKRPERGQEGGSIRDPEDSLSLLAEGRGRGRK